MDLGAIGDFIAKVGFPAFVAIFVLVRLEPAVKKLERSITAHMVITAKTNGMKSEDVKDIIALVARNGKKRRLADRADFPDDEEAT